jgi:hypothetical protein
MDWAILKRAQGTLVNSSSRMRLALKCWLNSLVRAQPQAALLICSKVERLRDL